MARRMREEGLISQAFVKNNALTYVRPNGSRQKIPIYEEGDLKKFAGGRNMSEFDNTG